MNARFRLLPRRALLPLLVALASGCARPVASPAPTAPSAPPARVGAAFWSRLARDLPGTWTMPGKAGPFTVSYKLISAGSVLVETWGVGSGHETMSVIHPDGDALVLTHYCAQGNQPRLHAVRVEGDAVVFRYVDGTNVLPDQAILVERKLRLVGDALDDTEIYRAPDGARDSTEYHLQRAPAPSPGIAR